MAADNGYFSESNAKKLEQKGGEGYMAGARQNHNPTLDERCAPEPKQPDTMTAMSSEIGISPPQKT